MQVIRKGVSMKEIYIAGAVRTAIGKFGGSIKNVSAVELGKSVIMESLKRSKINGGMIDEVIMGHVLTAGLGQSTARQSAVKAGIPVKVPALTINNVCGSGLRSVLLASSMISAGDGHVYVAGGMENMSQAAYVDTLGRYGHNLGHGQLKDTILTDALIDAFGHMHMGVTAENLAKKYQISREEQDEFALLSQMKAEAAMVKGHFKNEIIGIEVIKKKESVIFEKDEHLRLGIDMAQLKKLKPAFKENGTVTAGNASGINDGAAAMMVIDGTVAKDMGIARQAKIISYATFGHDPKMMGLTPVFATRKALGKVGMTIDDIDIIESNEAFSAQALAVGKELKWDIEKVNINGGAIALGHPVGASGARILVTLIHALKQKNEEYGLATICVGGGIGITIIIQNIR